jgi:AmmeMemoRadiSam system protein A
MWRPDPADGVLLVALARAAIARAVKVPGEDAEALLHQALEREVLCRPAAAFVTLRLGGDLRGCLGTLEPEEALARAVSRQAVAAALRDPRFPPLSPAELAPVRLCVSVLGPFTPVLSPQVLIPGRHGVALARGDRRSVFLPEVAVEQGWDVPTLLEQLAVKAGMRRGDWRGAALSAFETASFVEEAGTGAILRSS